MGIFLPRWDIFHEYGLGEQKEKPFYLTKFISVDQNGAAGLMCAHPTTTRPLYLHYQHHKRRSLLFLKKAVQKTGIVVVHCLACRKDMLIHMCVYFMLIWPFTRVQKAKPVSTEALMNGAESWTERVCYGGQYYSVSFIKKTEKNFCSTEFDKNWVILYSWKHGGKSGVSFLKM